MVTTKAKSIAPWKHDAVGEISGLLERYTVVGVLDISELPASQFQQIRRKLRGEAAIVVSKNTLMFLAMGQAAGRNPKLKDLAGFLVGQSALILSNMNPFKLNRFLRESRISAPAKPGSKSLRDIIIPAGDTDFSPGPVVAELQRVGIKARIQAGKVVILEDCHLLKEGDVITKEVSNTLAKFGIMPLELGLKLRAACEGSMIFSGEILDFDQKKALEQVRLAWASAFNLAVNADYPTSATVGIMISKAYIAAQNLALNSCLPVSQVMPALLARARAEMLGIAAALGTKDKNALDMELMSMLGIAPAEVKTEEKPAEEKRDHSHA